MPFPHGQSRTPLQHGLGSGVIVTQDGYILTNNHVVDGAHEVQVTLQDRREFTAQVVGRNSKTDLAVIKIGANHLPTVPLADSQKVQVGDTVVSIGNPFGVGQTVTHGIVSATDLGGMGLQDYEDFIQTDAAIDLTVAETKPESKVPVQILRNGAPKALEVTVGQLPGSAHLAQNNTPHSQESGMLQGVGVGDLDRQTREELNISRNVQGAVVTQVQPDSAAAQAGLKPGDVIESINHQPVKSADQTMQLTENAKDKHTLLHVWSKGGNHYVVLDESQTG